MTTNEKIGAKIRAERERRGLTAADLVALMEDADTVHPVSTNIIYRWEAGKQPIPADSLVALLTAMDCSPYAILGDLSPVEEEEKLLHRAIHALPVHDRRILSFLVNKWRGHFAYLLEVAMMYAVLEECDRKTAIRHCLRIFEKKRHTIGNAASYVDVSKVYAGITLLKRKDR